MAIISLMRNNELSKRGEELIGNTHVIYILYIYVCICIIEVTKPIS